MPAKRARTSSPPPHQPYVSSTIRDRSSTFIAHYSPTVSVSTLASHPDLQDASHRITAWRRRSSQQTISVRPLKPQDNASHPSRILIDSGSNDDGEKNGGKTVLKVMEKMNAEGALVVARWYGGIMLGPARFLHMENVAKEAISLYHAERDGPGCDINGVAEKKVKMDDKVEQQKNEELALELERRDASIVVLRGLLAEKKGVLDSSQTTTPSQTTTAGIVSPSRKVDYRTMPLQALNRLDKARDGTISWLLKEIEKVEKQIDEEQERAAETKAKD